VVNHLAIIMDGNGRWAEARGYGRPWGHRRGARQLDEIVEHAARLGIKHLTLYAFSSENWNRPPHEVNILMRLMVQFLRKMDKKLVRSHISLVAQGRLNRLPGFVRAELDRVAKLTDYPDARMKVNLSLSYGGRQELVDAAICLARQVQDGSLLPEQITEEVLSSAMYQPDFPDPDLLIRTGGQCRVSNFLLWQIAYSEIYVTDTLWPDFTAQNLEEALLEYGRRERRFGKTSAQVKNAQIEAHP
jgi:undecaprenyl diphosphate synthase